MQTKHLALKAALLALTIGAQAQSEPKPVFNFDFEKTIDGKAENWKPFGGSEYAMKLDDQVKRGGNYATSVEYKEGPESFGACSFTIPRSYKGKKITLTGYMKTENVTESAGLWLRLDPKIAFDNMADRAIKGTTDWTKYEITLPMQPDKTIQIVFGGLVVGKGKAWFDDFRITIDGKEIEGLTPLPDKRTAAQKDNQFTKGSGISLSAISSQQQENLRVLGLIWGYMKYYHPSVASGNYNWDFELFRVMPKVVEAKTNGERDLVLLSWIDQYGKVKCCTKDKVDEKDIKMKPDLDWISSSGFSSDLTARLLDIKTAQRSGTNYYIALHPGVGNPEFKNEASYADMKFPDDGYRMLTLYRYWNMIQYFFPYKNLIEEDWKNVLVEFIPRVQAVKNETEYVLLIQELIGRIHDTHANVWGGNTALAKYEGQRYAPVDVAFVEGKAEVVQYHDKQLAIENGLEVGDVITHVNGREVSKIVDDRLVHSPASNYPTKLRDIGADLLKTNEPTLEVSYVRNGIPQSKSVKTYTTNEMHLYNRYTSSDTCFKMLGNNVAYVNNSALKKNYLPSIWENAKKAKAIIIDIRNYPTDFPLYDFGAYLMPESTPYVKFSAGDIKNPGQFIYTPTLKVGKNNKDYFKGKVIILVNEISQSSAEFHSMAYRVHPNAIVVGSTTAGADGNVSEIVLPGGIVTMISGIGVYYPDGKETQRIGIVPDVEVKPTLEGIKTGRDEVLEKAIKLAEG